MLKCYAFLDSVDLQTTIGNNHWIGKHICVLITMENEAAEEWDRALTRSRCKPKSLFMFGVESLDNSVQKPEHAAILEPTVSVHIFHPYQLGCGSNVGNRIRRR
jgi:hypothetical protein